MPIGGSGSVGQHSDDDDDFFKPTPNSTLAKIFGIAKPSTNTIKRKEEPNPRPDVAKERGTVSSASKISDRYGSSSFRYVPPSATQQNESDKIRETKTSQEKTNNPEWIVALASVVTAYKLIDNNNKGLGKLGLALLKLDTALKIILYRTKTDALATLNVTPTTEIYVKSEYLQFRTDDESFWSVLFDKSVEKEQILTILGKVCLIHLETTEPPEPKPPVPAARSFPIVEEPESEVETSNKHRLISRMARMGQSILPQSDKTSSVNEVSDSSDTDVARIETIPRHHRRSGSGGKIHPVAIGMQMVPSSQAAAAFSSAIAGQSMMQTATDVNFNLFMTESRMQGTEVRMNLSKLETKLDRMLDKIELININNGSDARSNIDKDEDILQLEEKNLELKKENHVLKNKVKNLESKTSSAEEFTSLKDNLAASERQCNFYSKEIEQLQQDLHLSNVENDKNLKQIENLSNEITAKNSIISEKTEELKVLNEKLQIMITEQDSMRQNNALLVKQVENLEKSIASLEDQIQKQSPQKGKQDFDMMIKEIMNNCFQKLCDKLEDKNTLRVIGQTLKQETKAVLDRNLNQ
ncbi:uncharacterized protein LOC129756503 [Uranotaenia lowii]|uniref:uncharacterized protein LOC129756503 n=1 Tax=Uranotaenia lowii TaxID=190385 RepID=UPI002479D057|nr:uncharacterized protein LOC129756503 [Uranotaenia lowii]